jgi:hypothetical protein
MNYVWPACPSGKVIALTRPFPRSAPPGFGYVKELPKPPGGPPLLLCENNNLLGPSDAAHADISTVGAGRYSQWNNSMVFSASDNSDPNTNGRQYTVVQPD